MRYVCFSAGSQRTQLAQFARKNAHIDLIEAGQVGHVASTECHALEQVSPQIAQRLQEPLAPQDPRARASEERWETVVPSIHVKYFTISYDLHIYIIILFASPVPMNKVQVGHAPSPNLKAVRSKIGSLDNATYKPGGGHVKIESKKIDIKAAPRIEAKNDKYMPKGGEKKVCSYCSSSRPAF